MKSTDFDYKRIAEGYKNRPFLHKQVIEKFQEDIGGQHFALGLDIGCGAGLSTKALKYICSKVIGSDISPEMIRVAREVCGLDENITYIVSSAEEIAIPAEKVDIVTAAGAIQWIDRACFLSRIRQAMKDNGYLLIYDFAISDEMNGNPSYTDWWHNQYLEEFPRPYRDDSIWKNKDVEPYGFRMLKQTHLEMEHSFDLASFIEFMMIQSNVNARIDAGERKEEAAYQWFQETLTPIFHGENQTLLFKGYSWYLISAASSCE
ncbi:MAG: class I SAM-dependent methyltransferase [Lachnospiraceae bacterium]|nr:class I SAM-dependent methyltransferase [Lachnospiraceae bacterium]